MTLSHTKTLRRKEQEFEK